MFIFNSWPLSSKGFPDQASAYFLKLLSYYHYSPFLPHFFSGHISFLLVLMIYAHFCLWTNTVALPFAQVSFHHPIPPFAWFLSHFIQISPRVLLPLRPSSVTLFFSINFLSLTLLYFYQSIYYYLQLHTYVITCFAVFPSGEKKKEFWMQGLCLIYVQCTIHSA